MSKETLLNRQFTEREVQRMRNIITKKHGDKTQVSAGYEGKKHVEGDVWEEGGKTWTIKNGIKRNIPKLSQFKQQSIMPLCCPQCKEPLARQSEYVKHVYKLMHMCPKCVTKQETEMKLAGTYDDYCKKMHAQNHLDNLDNLEREFDNFVEHGYEKFMSEYGESETWDGKGMSPEQIKETKQWIADQKAKINTYLS